MNGRKELRISENEPFRLFIDHNLLQVLFCSRQQQLKCITIKYKPSCSSSNRAALFNSHCLLKHLLSVPYPPADVKSLAGTNFH